MATYNWKSSTSGSWNNPTLWDTGTTPVVTSNSDNSYFYGSADTTVLDTGSSTAYSVSGTASALSLQVAHDTVTFDNFVFFNDRGNDGSLALPTISITNGAAVLIGPNAKITTQQSGSFSYESFGRVTVNNAALTVQGSLTGILDIQAGGNVSLAAGGVLNSPATNHAPTPQALIEAGGIFNVQSGATAATPFQSIAGTLNLDHATAQSGNVDASGTINGSNGSTLNGLTYQYLGNTSNLGTIIATAGVFTITGSIAGTGKLLINPGAILQLTGADATPITFVGDNATLELSTTARVTGLLQGFGKGDSVEFDNANVTNFTTADANGVTTVTAFSGSSRLGSFALAGDYSGSDLALAGDGKGGSLISYVDHTPPVTTPPPSTTPPVTAPPTTTPPVNFLVTDTTTGVSTTSAGEAYVGPVSGIANDYITITPDNLALAAVTPNTFIHTGSGQDAIRALSGRNVLDGGTGSNFLTAGTGTDTFFVDARNAPSDTWSTVVGAKAGDDVTVFGITPDNFAVSWVDGQGAVGSLGLTMHATSASHPQASFTLAGFSTGDLASGKVSAAFGANGTEPYLNLHVN